MVAIVKLSLACCRASAALSKAAFAVATFAAQVLLVGLGTGELSVQRQGGPLLGFQQLDVRLQLCNVDFGAPHSVIHVLHS